MRKLSDQSRALKALLAERILVLVRDPPNDLVMILTQTEFEVAHCVA